MTDAELLKEVRKIIRTPEEWPSGSIYPSERLALAIIGFFKVTHDTQALQQHHDEAVPPLQQLLLPEV